MRSRPSVAEAAIDRVRSRNRSPWLALATYPQSEPNPGIPLAAAMAAWLGERDCRTP
jgi:hypothetical protein